MEFPLSFRPSGWDVVDRLTALYVERRQDIVLASMGLPSRALAEFETEHPAGYCDYPDPEERINRFWIPYLQERAALCDDSIPAAYLSEMDQGL